MHHSSLHYPLILLFMGVLLLLLGRRLFWLFVAVAGFITGVAAAPYILPHQGDLFTLMVAVVLGVLGAILAIFVQKLAVAIGGFIAGGYLAVFIGRPLLGGTVGIYPGEWLCFLVGGILGAILLLVFFNWALILLSSMEGAHMVLRGLPLSHYRLPRHHFPVLFLILAVIGIVVQAATYRRRPTAEP